MELKALRVCKPATPEELKRINDDPYFKMIFAPKIYTFHLPAEVCDDIQKLTDEMRNNRFRASLDYSSGSAFYYSVLKEYKRYLLYKRTMCVCDYRIDLLMWSHMLECTKRDFLLMALPVLKELDDDKVLDLLQDLNSKSKVYTNDIVDIRADNRGNVDVELVQDDKTEED